jgi:multidrug efflux pump subunit AcrA (membrane-fusion protein)
VLTEIEGGATMRARLNLEYTRIRAPISGRIGRALVTEGALVGQSEPTHVATIQQLDLRRFHPIGHRAESAAARTRDRRA